MKNGAFQISREIFDNPIWEDVIKFRLFFFIVGNAVFAENGVTMAGVHIKRGQYLRSYRNLQKDLQYLENRAVKQYSLSVIKKKIDQLVKENRLKIEDAEPGTLFTVVNYALYQGLDNYRNVTENGARTAREQGENNNKKDKKDKNVKDIKNIMSEGEKMKTYSEDFETFWKAYPLKNGKSKAYEHWKKKVVPGIKKGETTLNEILEGTRRYVEYCQKSGRPFKGGDTAVSHEVWEDEWNWNGETFGDKKVALPASNQTSNFLKNKLYGGVGGDRKRTDVTPGTHNIDLLDIPRSR